ncbi:MAG TPA: DUF6701 domain-containing protein, partial [Marinobacter sp.]|nr:DUF6701 domain-containing protein [Marinobacter sp.]
MNKIAAQWSLWLFAAFMTVLSSQVWAAQCKDVFRQSSGITQNLQATGNTLNLSSVPFANHSWPASGATLSSGDYFYAAATLPNNYVLNIASNARVRIFVNGTVSFANNLRLNANGSAQDFLLVASGGLSAGNGAIVSGLMYASGSIALGNNGDVSGGLAAGGAISKGNNTSVSADYSGADSGLLAGLCQRPVELSANGNAVGPVKVYINEPVVFSVTATGCPTASGSWFSHNWEDLWLENGSFLASSTFAASPCARSVQYTRTFPVVGTYTVRYSTEYCSASSFFSCNKYTTFGSDQITVDVVDISDGLTCFNDNFSAGTLNPDDWVTSVSKGPFTPSVVGGRLRMTEAKGNQATAATLQREIPGAENLVILEFDYYAYGGSGADGLAIVFSDATITPQPGSFGGSLGYAQRDDGDPGFAGGWIGIGLDEYGNFSNPSEGRQGGPGVRKNSVTIRGAYQGGYRYLEGTGTLSPGIDQSGSNPSPHRYRITVDSQVSNQAIITVERDTTGSGNNYQTIIAPFNALAKAGQSNVPDNFLLSLTGSTGGSTNIHELDRVQLCALKLNSVGKQVDHFEILHDGVALTCQPEAVTIRACSNPACNPLFTDPVTATLAPANGWLEGNPIAISGGTGSATLQKTTAGVITLGVVGSQPSTKPQAVTLCGDGSGPLSAANCSLRFYDTGLAFDIPDMTSHKPVSSVQIRAVRKDKQTEACVPAFGSVKKPVHFWSTYVNPGATGRPVSRPVSVNGTAIGLSQGTAQILDLDFDSNGVAEVDLVYPDAGQLNLNAHYIGSATTNDAGLIMPGADSFISSPAGFCVNSAGVCAVGNETCSTFVRAGELFNLDITAVGWEKDADGNLCQGNPETPNFTLSNIPLSINLVEPSAGVTGSLTPG